MHLIQNKGLGGNLLQSNFRIKKLDLDQGIKISKVNNWLISTNQSQELDLSQEFYLRKLI